MDNLQIKKTLKWGIIGSGGIASRRTIPEGFKTAKNARLKTVYDINKDVNASVAKKYNVHASSCVEELLSHDIDAVYVASPVNFHLDHVMACAQAQKHVLCEKPLGLVVSEAEMMVKACRDAGVILGTGFMMRFLSQHQMALVLIQEGKLGKPVYARAQLSCWYPPIPGAWRQDINKSGGGSLVDMGSHCIDLLQMFFGKIRKVSCFINNSVHSYKPEDSAVITLFFENGALATVDSFFCIPDDSSKNILELYGSEGSILARGTIGQGSAGEMIAYLNENQASYDAVQSRVNGDGMVIDPVPVNTYKAEIEEFSNAIIEGRKPKNNAVIGLQSMYVVEACYRSAQIGKIVELDDIKIPV